jgi:hypothetical protein
MAANSFNVSTVAPVSLAAIEADLILGILVKTGFDERTLFMMAAKAKWT